MAVVFVVGADQAGKGTLVQALLASRSHEDVSQDVEQRKPGDLVPPDREVTLESADARFQEYSWAINTKYYNAQVKLWRQRALPSIHAVDSVGVKDLEGVIAVFNLGQEDSFEQIKGWGPFAEKRAECTVRLCIGSKADAVSTPEPVQEERRRAYLDWCLDHGFEYIEADCRDAAKGGSLREKEGVPRVIEALESNMWARMSFKTEQRPMSIGFGLSVGQASGQQALAGHPGDSSTACSDQDSDQGSMAGYAELEAEPQGYEALDDDGDGDGPADTTSASSPRGTDQRAAGGLGAEHIKLQMEWERGPRDIDADTDTAGQVLEQAQEQAPPAATGTPERAPLEGAQSFAGTAAGEPTCSTDSEKLGPVDITGGNLMQAAGSMFGEDVDSDAVERLMAEVKHVRDQANHLSDEERRSRAAATAMSLLSLLGEEMEGEGDSDA